jgi:type I restriction-modification system DNA methylase subunit
MRLLQDDFFHWVASATYLQKLKPMFRALNRQLADYDFDEVSEDILKGVYQELIDLDTRHALGEYYTPDWLCERVVAELDFNTESRVLDPACGSGSFLRAVVSRFRKESETITADKIATHVVGIDIHPLSVQITKTTLLLALGPLIPKAQLPVTLHVYLANSLLVPRATADLFKSTFTVSVDNEQYSLDIAGLNGPEDFDKLVTFCDDLVTQYKEDVEKIHFVKLADKTLPEHRSHVLAEQLYDVYGAMKRARDKGRDSIWKFILQNSYKPVFLGNQFDIIVGNPPWLTYAQMANADYQFMLRALADDYAVTPSGANMPHMEIAAIFLAHSINHFMKSTGRLAMVLPRSFMTADQHDNTRGGMVKGVQLIHIWDLKDVEPLFRVPCCVVFAKHGEKADQQRIPDAGITGYALAGRLPRSQIHWVEASKFLVQTKTRWYYSKLQGGKGRSRSALTQTAMVGAIGRNAYGDQFKQGATIVPRSFYFIDIDQDGIEGDYAGRVISVKTAVAALREAKAPWKVTLSGRIEGDFLFRTALSKNIIPFALVSPPLMVLPVAIEENSEGNRQFILLDHDQLMGRGARNTSKWFLKASELWNRHRTENNAEQEISLLDYLNWQNKLVNQDPDARFLVIYTSSATDASATVVDRRTLDLPFIVDHKAYWCETSTQAEAHYVCAYLNSGYANMQIKEFQSRGLFGPRDIHKTIVKLPFPKFDAKTPDHKQLAYLGEKCAAKVSKLFCNGSTNDLQARALGRLRNRIRDELTIEIDEIDIIVEKLSTGKSEAAIRASGKGTVRKKSLNKRLFE